MYVRSLWAAALAASLVACSSEEDPSLDSPDGGSEDDGGVLDGGASDASDGSVDARIPAVCGDGIKHSRELCDDGNTVSGDGCRADCQNIDPGFSCATAGSPCLDVSVCNDGVVSGREQCDDGNATAADGCSATCQVEPGYACNIPGRACRAAACGDAMRVGLEQCDDGNMTTGDGCDDHCRVEEGYVCSDGSGCRKTVCGDKIVEGSEQCDDDNDRPYDGCYKCQREPVCNNAVCTAACGDGIKFPGEACDDGNTRSGDGCSSTCTLESGYGCTLTTSATPTTIAIPIVYRDFRGFDLPAIPASNLEKGHEDFENKNNGLELGLVNTLLGNDKKPVLARTDASIKSAATFSMWYNDDVRYNRAVTDALTFTRGSDGSYVFNSNAFFPLDKRGFVGAGFEALRTDGDGAQRNFHFTSELRYWFEYKGGEFLEFSGDDDVWVFINGRLAVDIGGVHGRETKSVTLTNGNDARFSLAAGGIYEVVVFQAERHTSRSQYKLTLRGFEKARSSCASVCGDMVVTPDEVCDDGKNDGSYGSCTPDCQNFGPYCGNGKVEGSEQCDDGNKDTADGCSNSCTSISVI